MGKYLSGVLIVIFAIAFMLSLTSCTQDEEVHGTCAGCPDDSPWSLFGSDQCYTTQDLCQQAEKGDCVICK